MNNRFEDKKRKTQKRLAVGLVFRLKGIGPLTIRVGTLMPFNYNPVGDMYVCNYAHYIVYVLAEIEVF